ncbi:MAG: hypothetical protein H7263_13170 [Candidatus Sericytochromatia bacterium]|nr:hypothetical protein [Candidatus Sericytochromatia bacterium]
MSILFLNSHSVNKELILMYLEMGKVISERVKIGWGDLVIDTLSKDLQAEYIGVKGFYPKLYQLNYNCVILSSHIHQYIGSYF